MGLDASSRRKEILTTLKEQSNAVSARKLAGLFNVSRQVIVGDVALLRAAGEDIIATPRGYIFNKQNSVEEQHFSGKIVCQHTNTQAEEELQIIVDNGGEVVDVEIEHSFYGTISAHLEIKSRHDLADFLKEMKENEAKMLSSLTDGVHLHTIKCADQETFERIKNQLLAAGILYGET